MFKKQLCLAVLLASAFTCAAAETGKTQAEQDFAHAFLRLKKHIDASVKTGVAMYLITQSKTSVDDAEKVAKEVLPQTAASVKQMVKECYQSDTDERKLCPYMDIQFQYIEPRYTFQAPKKDTLDGLHPETQAWIQNHPEETGMAHALLDSLVQKAKH